MGEDIRARRSERKTGACARSGAGRGICDANGCWSATCRPCATADRRPRSTSAPRGAAPSGAPDSPCRHARQLAAGSGSRAMARYTGRAPRAPDRPGAAASATGALRANSVACPPAPAAAGGAFVRSPWRTGRERGAARPAVAGAAAACGASARRLAPGSPEPACGRGCATEWARDRAAAARSSRARSARSPCQCGSALTAPASKSSMVARRWWRGGARWSRATPSSSARMLRKIWPSCVVAATPTASPSAPTAKARREMPAVDRHPALPRVLPHTHDKRNYLAAWLRMFQQTQPVVKAFAF